MPRQHCRSEAFRIPGLTALHTANQLPGPRSFQDVSALSGPHFGGKIGLISTPFFPRCTFSSVSSNCQENYGTREFLGESYTIAYEAADAVAGLAGGRA